MTKGAEPTRAADPPKTPAGDNSKRDWVGPACRIAMLRAPTWDVATFRAPYP